MSHGRTLGSLFAGIGGFDLGFERAGWDTVWQVEIDRENRAVLADRFPRARQLSDVRTAGSRNLSRVDCIALGFPCQDISIMGQCGERKGLRGERSGLFEEGLRIIDELRPEWLVIENVPRLLTINAGEDFAHIVQSLAKRGYVGLWRVLDAQHFGISTRRRRLFLVAGLGRHPSMEFLADASPVVAVPSSFGASQDFERAAWIGYCLTAPDKRNGENSRFSHGSENFVAEENGWGAMLERARETEERGLLVGLAPSDIAEAWGAGNAVCPQVAEWIAQILNRS